MTRYDPYGNLVSQSGSLINANVYRFSSKEFHEISGLYYYGYRFYSPTLQRWINRDPIGMIGGANLFAFVRNSPVVAIDTLGLRDCPSWAEYRCANPLSSGPFLEVGKIIWGALKSGAKRCFRLVAGAGKICVSANCKAVDLSTSGVTYLADDEPVLPSGKLGAPTRRSLPGPGECVDADALYVPGAAYKIRDVQMIVIDCSSGSPIPTGDISLVWSAGEGPGATQPPVTDWPSKKAFPPYILGPPEPPAGPLYPWLPAPGKGHPWPYPSTP